MKTIIVAAAVLAALIAGSASAETFHFPAGRANRGVHQVDIAMAVIMHPDCAGRWSVEYPRGFAFRRGGPNGGNLYGNPGKGSYEVAIKTQACHSRDSDYVDPARTVWHKIVVY
ncbi:hypothetical protein [Agrobacterium tumefaciens]|uniref:hypothetical protein n=1 Tax=Agrobacterium tumefaciens TaxID=358 RepID=UPI0021CE661D|nr:hypothetical protein [Agrobacterium tumefaciens]UXT99762.1 hypothetical protein FY129_20070 [Agrobacterium tumefaciens]